MLGVASVSADGGNSALCDITTCQFYWILPSTSDCLKGVANFSHFLGFGWQWRDQRLLSLANNMLFPQPSHRRTKPLIEAGKNTVFFKQTCWHSAAHLWDTFQSKKWPASSIAIIVVVITIISHSRPLCNTRSNFTIWSCLTTLYLLPRLCLTSSRRRACSPRHAVVEKASV